MTRAWRGAGRQLAFSSLALLAAVAVVVLIQATSAHASGTYWVDICANGNQAGALSAVSSGDSAKAKMSTDCGAGSNNSLSVTVTNSGVTTSGSSTTATTTYNSESAEAQANWVVYAPIGESFVGLTDSGATYASPSTQTGYGPGTAWGLGFAWFNGSWSDGPSGAQTFSDCINGGTACGTSTGASSTGAQTGTFPAVTAENWGASCAWVPAATTDCNNDGAKATLTNWRMEISDPSTGATVTPVTGLPLNADEGHWVSGATASGASGSWTLSDPGGVCSESTFLAAVYAQDGTTVGQQFDASTQASAPFNSADGDFTQTTCTGAASLNFTPVLTSLPTGAYNVDAGGADPAQYVAGSQTVSTNGVLYVDNNTPSVSFTGPAAAPWYPGPTAITVNASDGAETAGQNSGIASVSCSQAVTSSWANGAQNAQGAYAPTQAEPITLSALGTSTLTCGTTNGVGTNSAPASVTIHIDSQKPALRMSKVLPAPDVLDHPPTFTATGSEAKHLSGVTTACSARNLSTGDRLSTTPAARTRLTLTSGGKWTVTCTATTGAGNRVSQTERVDLATQPLGAVLKISFHRRGMFWRVKHLSFSAAHAGTVWRVTLDTGGHRLVRGASGKAAVASLIKWLDARRFLPGDKLSFKLTRPGYRTTAGSIVFLKTTYVAAR